MSSSLTLDLSDEHIMSKLKWEIQESRKVPVTKVQIECLNSEFWVGAGTSLSDGDLHTIFAYIGHAFPHLKEIEMKVFELPLPVAALSVLLQLTKDTLQGIDMEDVVLKGSQDELEGLASTFHNHPTLQKVSLDWCQPICGTLDPVFSQLSTIPTLTQVKICGSILSVASLRVLFSNQSIKRLSLLDDNLPDAGVVAIADALGSPKQHVRELSVRLCGLAPATGIQFANVLRDNHTLEKLEVRIKDGDWNAYGSAFADALQKNDTLTHVTLFIDGSNTNADAAADQLVTRVLAHHETLKSVRIALRGVVHEPETDTTLPDAFLERIRRMLQTNTRLEELHIDGMDHLPHDIQFFLRANRLGRKELLQNPSSHNLWIQSLIQHRHNVAFTHFLLSLNPTLCPQVVAARPLVFEV